MKNFGIPNEKSMERVPIRKQKSLQVIPNLYTKAQIEAGVQILILLRLLRLWQSLQVILNCTPRLILRQEFRYWSVKRITSMSRAEFFVKYLFDCFLSNHVQGRMTKEKTVFAFVCCAAQLTNKSTRSCSHCFWPADCKGNAVKKCNGTIFKDLKCFNWHFLCDRLARDSGRRN